MTNADIGISIGLDTDNLKRGVADAKNTLGGLGDFVGGALKVGLFGAVAGVAALTAGLGVAVKAAMDAEEGQAALNAVLESTHGVAGVTADMANDLASSLQNVTRFEDDTILAAENMLLTFTKIGKDIFPDATETALNMATAFKMGPEQAAVMLGKALQDPIKGMSALQRVGVNFTDAQKEQAKAMVEAGDLMGAQKIILAELAVETGNAARAAGDTFAGKMDILNHKFGDLQEQIGGALIPILTEVATVLIDALGSPEVQSAIDGVVQGLVGAIGFLRENFPKLKEIIGNVVKFIAPLLETLIGFLTNLTKSGQQTGAGMSDAFEKIQAVLGAVWNFIRPILGSIFQELSKFWTEIQPKLAAAWENIQKVTMQVFGAIVQFIQDHSEEIRNIFEGAWKIIQGIFKTAWALIEGIVKIALDLLAGDFDAAGKDFQQMMTDIWAGIQLIIQGAWQEIQGYVALALNTLGQAIWTKLTEIGGWFNQQFANIISYLQSLPAQFVQLGMDMIQGIIDGLWQAAGNVNSALWDIIQQAINNALNVFGGGGGGPSFAGEMFGGGPAPMLPPGNSMNFGGITINFNGENAPRTRAEADQSASLFIDALRSKGYAV